VIIITIVSPSNASVRSAPGGVGILAEVYEIAGLTDELSVKQLPDRWLFASLDKLRRQYPNELQVRWVSPYSLLGLYVTVRFRIREYPTIIIGSRVLSSIANAEDFERHVMDRLEADES
jgi:hypothetical protein